MVCGPQNVELGAFICLLLGVDLSQLNIYQEFQEHVYTTADKCECTHILIPSSLPINLNVYGGIKETKL